MTEDRGGSQRPRPHDAPDDSRQRYDRNGAERSTIMRLGLTASTRSAYPWSEPRIASAGLGQSTMSNWMFFGSPLFGHTNPTLPVVAELVKRGEHIVYYNADRFEAAICSTGAEFRAYKNFPTVPEPISTRMVDVVPILAEAEEVFLADELEAIRGEHTDFVIHDCLAIWGATATRVLGVPRIASIPTLLVNDSVTSLAKRIMPRPIRPGRGSLRIWDAPMIVSSFLRRIRTNRRYGLKYRQIRDIFHGELNVVFTSKDIQPFADEFDDSFRFVGSPTIERTEGGDFPFDKLDTGRPIVYVSLGTLFNNNIEFFRACFEALGELDVQVVLSKGKQKAGVELPPEPENFLVFDYVPQIAVLKRAAAFITHGGIGSSSEALHLGVPQVLIPQIWDGYLMAHQMAQKGAGILLSSPVSSESLRSAVNQVLADESFRRNSRALGEGLVEAGGAERAADEILKWTQGRKDSARETA